MARSDLFLAGDVMTGRGIDQILPHPSSPELYEPYLEDARDYIELAESVNGAVPRGVALDYVWGDALAERRQRAPDVRIVNLETSVTTHDVPWPEKGINYRMHPENVGCLAAAGLDLCVLANNHVLDWGRPGLVQTLDTLRSAGIATVGAGRTRGEAEQVAALPLPRGGRVLVVAVADASSGVPPEWQALSDLPGVASLPALDDAAADAVTDRLSASRRPGDVAVVSVHWGSNWGYEVPVEQVRFAHRLVARGADVVHGHSSHHPRPVEMFDGHPILYGCGDLLSDYEGIAGHASFRPDLVHLWFVGCEGGRFEVRVVPMRLALMRLERAAARDVSVAAATLEAISRPFGVAVRRSGDEIVVRPQAVAPRAAAAR